MVDALEPAVEELRQGVASGMKLKEAFENAALKAAEAAGVSEQLFGQRILLFFSCEDA